jgi:hypothetical protein
MRAPSAFGATAVVALLVACAPDVATPAAPGPAVFTSTSGLGKGSPVEIERDGSWSPGTVVDAAPGRLLVHYEGLGGDHDEIVDAARVRPRDAGAPPLARGPVLLAGARVEALRRDKWLPATVVEATPGRVRVRYDAFGEFEETVDASRVRAPGDGPRPAATVETSLAPTPVAERELRAGSLVRFVDPPVGTFAPLHPAEVGLGFAFGPTWFKQQAATAEGLASAAPTIGLGLTVDIYEIVSASFTYERVFTSDNKGFKETVTDQFGNVLEASSTTHVNVFLLSGGLRTPPRVLWGHPETHAWGGLFAYTRLGAALVAADRSIDDCDDCPSGDLKLKGGAFVEPGLKYYTGGPRLAVALGVSYRVFLSGSSFAGDVPIALEFWFR